jgi:uncharacterized protein
MERRSLYIITGQVLLAITIVASTFIATHSLKQIKLGHGTISVKGCAEKEIQSDFVKWQGSISAIAETQIQAFEKLEQDLEILRMYMLKQGIPLKNVMFSPIFTTVNYLINEHGNLTNTVESYTLSQDFSISSSEIVQVSDIAQNITSLIKDGLSITSTMPQYFYLKFDELKIAMLGEAAKDAKMRAEELVSKSGSQVGRLRAAHQGVFQITPAFSNSVSDYGEYDTSSIAKRIKAVVTMEYAIN